MDIGTHIKTFRHNKKISQVEFAEYFPEFGMKQEHVSFYERGRRSVSSELMEAMVKAGVIPEAITDAPERVRQMMGNMEHEDQTLVEHFVRRMMR